MRKSHRHRLFAFVLAAAVAVPILAAPPPPPPAVNAQDRAAIADDIAAAVLWLCSDDSRFYTGNAMRIDAGASLR